LIVLADRVRTLEKEIARFTDAIGAGGDVPTLVKALKTREAECARLEAERRQIELWASPARPDLGAIDGEIHRRVEEWRTMATRTVAQGRQILRKLLAGRVVMTPDADRRCVLSGRTDYGKLFSGIELAMSFLRDR
jgi:hypothetical protein